MDISVIIPVYNVEKYLIRCLDSIFNQQFTGTFEVITVDDSSTDNSLQILYAYQKHENRLHIFTHDSNKKQSIARATGMNASTGNYIMHVDADDCLLPNTFEKLFSKITQTNVDVIVFNIIRENRKSNKRLLNTIQKELITTDKLKVQKHFFGSSVNKITKRTLTENMISGTIGVNTTEDLLYSFELLLRSKTIYLMPEYFYLYSTNIESVTNTVQPEEYIKNQVIILNQVQLIAEKYKPNFQLIENVLNYIEKWLYLMFAQLHFEQQIDKDINLEIISRVNDLSIMNQTRINKLKLAIIKKYCCLLEVTRRFSIRTSLGIICRSLNNYS